MPKRPTRFLRHEYELFVEAAIERYKESLSRHDLLAIGDEAVAALGRETQLALTELVLAEEVDRLIGCRLRLPSYRAWRRTQFKLLPELRRPERWGLSADDVVVRLVAPTSGGDQAHVLVAGDDAEAPALYLAANGCDVTTVTEQEDDLDRVMRAAVDVGIAARVHGCLSDLACFRPTAPLNAVIVTPGAMHSLSRSQRECVIEMLKSATTDGGVHLVQAIAAGQAALSLSELRSRYRDWQVSVECTRDAADVFLARKHIL